MAPTKTTRAGSFIKSKKATFTKLLFDPVAPRQPIIDPWLDRGSSALIWGPTGVGKSYFAQTLALMVATGGRLPNLGWNAGGDKPLKTIVGAASEMELTRTLDTILAGDGAAAK